MFRFELIIQWDGARGNELTNKLPGICCFRMTNGVCFEVCQFCDNQHTVMIMKSCFLEMMMIILIP